MKLKMYLSEARKLLYYSGVPAPEYLIVSRDTVCPSIIEYFQ